MVAKITSMRENALSALSLSCYSEQTLDKLRSSLPIVTALPANAERDDIRGVMPPFKGRGVTFYEET
jgi:hypothetical protein